MPTGNALFETDETITEQTLYEAFAMLGLTDRVVSGLAPTSSDVDTSANTVDMPSGTAVLLDTSTTPTRATPIKVNAESGIALDTGTGVNYIYLVYDPNASDATITDDLTYDVRSSEVSPTNPSLLVATADGGSGSVTLYNRGADLTAETPFVVEDDDGTERARVDTTDTTLDALTVTNDADIGSLTGALADSETIQNLVGENLRVDNSGNLDVPDRNVVSLDEGESPDGSFSGVPVAVPAGSELRVLEWGAVVNDGTADGASPTGLKVGVQDLTGSLLASEETAYTAGSFASPVATISNTSGSLRYYVVGVDNGTGTDYTEASAGADSVVSHIRVSVVS